MMRHAITRLLGCWLLLGLVGCGSSDPTAALEQLGAKVKRNAQGEVLEVDCRNTEITDANLVHLSGLTTLEWLGLPSQITDQSLVHLKGLTGLHGITLVNSQISEAGITELQAALPNCTVLRL